MIINIILNKNNNNIIILFLYKYIITFYIYKFNLLNNKLFYIINVFYILFLF